MKRGIIPLYKIGILFLEREFEHDVYELIRAFYPESSLSSFYAEDEVAECDLFFRVEEKDGNCLIRYENNEKKGVITAEFTEGQSSDALISCDDREGAHSIRKERKDQLKIALYHLLVKLTGKTLPWGNLTGIRPAKLAMGLIESGMKNTEVAREMRERYLVSPQKTALAITIANREREILKDIDYENGYSLYVGIPFCPSICLYCSFSSYPLKQWKDKVDLYVEALCKEIREVSRMMKGRKLDTIYIGGGTPTTLEPYQLERLLDCLSHQFGYDGLLEFTVEAGRPDTITADKLQAMKERGITRISINPQTLNDEVLKLIGRDHTTQQTLDAFHLARAHGFDNINMDLIVGLAGDSVESFRNTLDGVVALHPESITVHTLALKRSSNINKNGKIHFINDGEGAGQMLDYVDTVLTKQNYIPYYLYRQSRMVGNLENTGWAKPGYENYYNVYIMDESHTILACGAGAVSKIKHPYKDELQRIFNFKFPYEYIDRYQEMLDRKEKVKSIYKQFLLSSAQSSN